MKKQMPQPPIAAKKHHSTQYHDENYVDNYYWMRNRDSEEVIAYLNEENAYTKAIMADTEAVQQQLFEEIKGRLKEEDESVPVFEDGYFYYTRVEEGKQYKIHCRKKETLSAKEEIILDENQLAGGKDYFSLGELTVSPNNELIAYSTDETGDEEFTIFIQNLTSGKILQHQVEQSYYGLEWAADNQHIFYTKLDEAHRPYQLWCHNISQSADHDTLKFEEPDDAFFIDVSKTKDNQYILLSLGSQITSEVWFLDAKQVDDEFTLIAKREEGVEYDVGHYLGEFHILTNANGAKNFAWMKTLVTQPGKEHWQAVIPYNSADYLQEIEIFHSFFVVQKRVDGQKQLTVYTADLAENHTIVFDETAFNVDIGDNPQFDTPFLRLHYQSLVTPHSTFDYDMVNRQLIEKKVQVIPSGHQKEDYHSERIMVTAHDGEQIPVSLVYKKGLRNTAQGNPMYLYAYGSYGINVNPYFSIAQLSLLDRGFIFAIAHIRGSSSKGRNWYESGKFLQKKNTFQDFITVAKHFISTGYTTPHQLVANGGSAGGLLMGAVANMAGELFHTIVADVPFVDVINTMMDESIPLTVTEYDEWGNPNEKEFFDYMLSYSPYDNVETKNYPNLLVTAGLNDPRVQYWEPAKWVAKLREKKTDDNLLLLKTNMDAGHAGVSGRFERIKETAFEFAFILKTLGRN